MRIGTAQFSELTWQRRKLERYSVQAGMLLPKLDGEAGHSSVYLPYSVGLLQAYVTAHASAPERYSFQMPLFERVSVADGAAALEGLDVAAFSTYVWNIGLSLAIADRVRASDPDVLIVFGGPQVPDHAEQFLREHPFIDIVVHGEGEPVFLQVLEALPGRDWSSVPSVSYLDAQGVFHHQASAPRVSDLERVPSPYLTGVFDDLIAQREDRDWLVTWETNRGCPFSCSFCDWGSAVAAKVNRFPMERLEAEMDWFARHGIGHIFLIDANFGLLPRDIEIAKALGASYEAHHSVAAVSVQSAKNAADRTFQVQRALAESSAIRFVGATMAMQSVSPTALSAVRRSNISLDDYTQLQRRYREVDIPTYTDLILGLPGETFDSFADGLDTIMSEGQHNRLAVYNCSVLPNAEMGEPRYQEVHGIEYVPILIVHEHDPLYLETFVPEYLNTVVATATMPRADWVRTRTFASLVELLHYDRLLQIPFVVLASEYGIPFREILTAFFEVDAAVAPVVAGVRDRFAQQAVAIQGGEPEFIPSERHLGCWWPLHQYGLVTLVLDGRLDSLYAEARALLLGLLERHGRGDAVDVLDEALALNAALVRRPRQRTDVNLESSYNVLEYYRDIVAGSPTSLRRVPTVTHVRRTGTVWLSDEAWCEDVVLTLYDRELLLYPAYAQSAEPVGAPAAMVHQ